MANRRLYPFWGSLTEALRTGQPQNEIKQGINPFLEIYADPVTLGLFLRAMTGVSLPVAEALARRFAWQSVRSFVDIGTAEGGLPVVLARAHPHLTGGGFDLPPVRPLFEAHVARHGLGDRLRFYVGDFLNEPLPSADVLVMGHILHDWDLATKRRLLAKAHAALPPGGTLLVYDQMIDDARRASAAGLLMSLNMLIETPGGFDYTGADCLLWLREAGFAEAQVEPLVGPYALAVGIKGA
jgi:SAM-dependent methyltransferase